MFKPRFEGQPAHITPPIAPYHAGPAGMVYDPGTALSDEWRNHFFVASFQGSAANARIRAFRLRTDGAGFALESDRVLLQGILTVGMKFGPDGALYLADWIRGWESKGEGRIWKVDSPAAALERRASGRAVAARGRISTRAPRADLGAAAAACRHAGAAEGPVRAGPARRRHHAPAGCAPGAITSSRGSTACGASRSSLVRTRSTRRCSRSSSTIPIPRSGRKPPG